uniref:Uncharacterized protein n=1 Tax=Pyricularia oryzae (strain P131) TaxID=1143193 RepID=L7JN94_PYRO1
MIPAPGSCSSCSPPTIPLPPTMGAVVGGETELPVASTSVRFFSSCRKKQQYQDQPFIDQIPIQSSTSLSTMASGFGTSRIRRSKTHVVPFQDHAGQPALSTFNADESCPLPYLYSYCIYFTHPNVRPDVPHSADAVRRLYETIVIENAPFNPCDCLFRLDMYFLPNGNRDECMRHYRAERDARGSYMVQVEAVESSAAQPTAETARMPGLVPSYARQDMSRHSYHALIYVCDAPDWRGGEDETITRLEFEPLSQGDYERFNKDPEDQHEPDMLPETAAVLETIGKNSPGFGKPTPAMPRQSRLDGRFTEMWYMADHMFDRAPRQRMGEDAWQEARERGWTSW